MQKSTCYRLIKNNTTGATEYVLTPSYLEVMKDSEGREFRIHFHKVEHKYFTEWSATEESTGLKCIDSNRDTRKDAYHAMLEIIPKLNEVMKRYTHYIDKMREFRSKNL